MDSGSALYRRWVLFCTVGEVVGFGGIPVLAGAATLLLTANLAPEIRSVVLYVVSTIGGLGEGAVLAWFQLRVLRGRLPRLDPGQWVRNTAFAASFAWSLGMLAPTLDDLIGLSAGVQVAIWVPASVVILLSIGTAQSWVLRDVVRRPRRWLAANLVGWLLGLIWTFVLPALLPEDAPLSWWVAVFVVAGILMGMTVGLVTGAVLVKLEPLERPAAFGRGKSA
jgi:hypothetical protein